MFFSGIFCQNCNGDTSQYIPINYQIRNNLRWGDKIWRLRNRTKGIVEEKMGKHSREY